MLYKHRITGVVINVGSTMGGDWQEVTPASPDHAPDQKTGKPAPEKAVSKNGRTVRNKK